MADGGAGAKGPTNFWDVVLHLVQRFPVFAITLTFIGAGLYVGSLVLADKNQAERELLAARQSIEADRLALRQAFDAERRQMQAEIERERREARDAIARAVEREKAAEVKVAEAEAQALLKVQDALLGTASRIQELVKGQLGSMEDIDALRLRTVDTMKTEMANLETQRETAKKELDTLKSQARTGELTFSINALEDALKNTPYSVDDAIARVSKFLDIADGAAMDVITRRIGTSESPLMRGSLQYAVARKTGDRTWIDRLAATLKDNTAELGEYWYELVLGCCDLIDEPLWSALLPTVAELVANPDVQVEARFALLGFFQRSFGIDRYIFANEDYRGRDELWKALEFSIAVARGDHQRLNDYRRASAWNYAQFFDPAAAHVWASHIAGSDSASE